MVYFGPHGFNFLNITPELSNDILTNSNVKQVIGIHIVMLKLFFYLLCHACDPEVVLGDHLGCHIDLWFVLAAKLTITSPRQSVPISYFF